MAHRAAAAFNDPEGFLKKNEISLQDFQDLVDLAEEIVNEHYERFDDMSADFTLPMIGIERLTTCAQAKDDIELFIRDLMGHERKPDFADIKIKAVDSLLKRQKVIS